MGSLNEPNSSVDFTCDRIDNEESNNILVIDDHCPSTSSEYDNVAVLQEVCSNASHEQILLCLNKNDGNVDRVAQELLGISNTFTNGELDNSDDDEIITAISMHVHSTPENMKTASKSLSPSDALKEFQSTIIREDAQRENFYVSRLEGSEELKRDIFSLYKNPKKNLRAPMKVRFDGEEGVGSGTVREFFEAAMKIPQEGIGGPGKPIVYFEGEKDHLLPIHNQIMQQMGAYTCIGKIVGHSILHGGPGLVGMSPAAKHYWVHDHKQNPSPLVLEDIPDINLRGTIQELQQLDDATKIPADLRVNLEPYMMEAGIELELMCVDPRMVIQGLMWYFIINKRKLELNDIAKGMNEVSLQKFLTQQPSMLDIFFPSSAAMKISAIELLGKVSFDLGENVEREVMARDMFEQYVLEIENSEDGCNLNDLCYFWMACHCLPARGDNMFVTFDADLSNKMPKAETCFMKLILPVSQILQGTCCHIPSMVQTEGVHNQRIERLWRDVFFGCTHTCCALFGCMGDSGILDPSD